MLHMVIDSIRVAGWSLPEPLLKRLGEKAGRQRAMAAEGHLLLILHAIPKHDEIERTPRLFWRPPDGKWRGIGTSGDGAAALRRHVEEFVTTIDEMEHEVEGATDADTFYQTLLRIAPIHRTARNLHAALQQARELVDDPAIISLRDRAGEVERAAELLHGDAKVGLEYSVAKAQEDQARTSLQIAEAGHRLNLLAAVFLPLTAVAALFGMNLPSGLESRATPLPFWLVLGVALTLGVCLGLSLRVRKR